MDRLERFTLLEPEQFRIQQPALDLLQLQPNRVAHCILLVASSMLHAAPTDMTVQCKSELA